MATSVEPTHARNTGESKIAWRTPSRVLAVPIPEQEAVELFVEPERERVENPKRGRAENLHSLFVSLSPYCAHNPEKATK